MTTTLVVCAVAWVLGWWALGRLRRLSDVAPAEVDGAAPSGGRVTVVIPARNEELSLRGILGDLDRERPADCRVVVVDDHSTDATAAIAESFPFVEVIPAPDLPDGWTGKCWACHTGASAVEATAADDDVIVFLDADVRLEPGALGRLSSELRRRGGLVSVQPFHSTDRPYEQLSALFNVIGVMGTGAGGRGPVTGAFGPVLATSVGDYRTVGGHASVCDEVVEDLALAARYQQAGLGVDVLTGAAAIRFRMYPAGVRQLVEGWTKNFASGAGATRPGRLLAVIAWIVGMSSAATALLDGVRGNVPLAIGVTLYALFVAQLAVMFRKVGSFGLLTAALYPLLVVFFFGVFARSTWRTHVRHSVEWRGRKIAVGARG